MSTTIAIVSSEPAIRVDALLSEAIPTLSGNDGGWNEVERPDRKAFTEWTGTTPLHLEVGLLLDGFASDTSVETEIASLTRLARPQSDLERPCLVTLLGDGLPISALDIDWAIMALTWGDAIRTDGVRVRQAVTISFIEYVEPDLLLVKKTPTPGAKPPKSVLYKVRKGDTLPKIAARRYKKASRWREIVRLNPGKLRGPNIPTKLIGTKIKVPIR